MEEWRVGDVKVFKIEELVEVIDGTTMVCKADRKNVKQFPWLLPHYATEEGDLIFSIHAFVLQTPSALIIVDTCLGEGKASTIPSWDKFQSRFIEQLALAGFNREDFDYVLCTHLHEDHIGWNTMRVDDRWEPTFPNASYLVSESEWRHWQGSDYAKDILAPSIQPISDMKLYKFIQPPYFLTDEVSLIPTPGHTSGHVSVAIKSKSETAVITGDLLLSPIQMSEPDWKSASDVDVEQARLTRKDFFENCCNNETLVLGTHFPTPTGGFLYKVGKGWKINPPYT